MGAACTIARLPHPHLCPLCEPSSLAYPPLPSQPGRKVWGGRKEGRAHTCQIQGVPAQSTEQDSRGTCSERVPPFAMHAPDQQASSASEWIWRWKAVGKGCMGNASGTAGRKEPIVLCHAMQCCCTHPCSMGCALLTSAPVSAAMRATSKSLALGTFVVAKTRTD